MELDPGVDYCREKMDQIKEIKDMMKKVIEMPEPGEEKLPEFPDNDVEEKKFDEMYQQLVKESDKIPEKFTVDQVYDNYRSELCKPENNQAKEKFHKVQTDDPENYFK